MLARAQQDAVWNRQDVGAQTRALLLQLDAAGQAADDLAEATGQAFHQHPDAAIITSFPGLADLAGARVLAEIGDDRTRFADARALKVYAGAAPITRASGRSLAVHHRKAKNQRLAAAGYVWAFTSSKRRARAHYDHRRGVGDRHSSALSNTFNRLLAAACSTACRTANFTTNQQLSEPASRRSTTPPLLDEDRMSQSAETLLCHLGPVAGSCGLPLLRRLHHRPAWAASPRLAYLSRCSLPHRRCPGPDLP